MAACDLRWRTRLDWFAASPKTFQEVEDYDNVDGDGSGDDVGWFG